MPRDDKVAILKESLAAIGRRIEVVLEAKQAAGEDRERWRRHLWTCVNELVSYRLGVLTSRCLRFVTLFWPKKVKAGKLEEIHAKMVIKEGGDANVPKKANQPATVQPRHLQSGPMASHIGDPDYDIVSSLVLPHVICSVRLVACFSYSPLITFPCFPLFKYPIMF